MTNRNENPNVTTKEDEVKDIHGNSLSDIHGEELVVIGPEIAGNTERIPN